MMVTFISQCEKKALKKTRRVLDAFADRIGDNTWQTVITEAGLKTVKKMLRQTASKSTAVSCHWIRSRSRSQFLWVVGNKSKFDVRGVVPVNITARAMKPFMDKHAFKTLPVIRHATAIAGLFHDVGKSTRLFQRKLNPAEKTENFEPFRHEWLSFRLFQAFVGGKNDKKWLTVLSDIVRDAFGNTFKDGIDEGDPPKLPALPPFAKLVAWLILSHHKLSVYPDWKDNYNNPPGLEYVDDWLDRNFDATWNSHQCRDESQTDRIRDNWQLCDLPTKSMQWRSKACLLASAALVDLRPWLNQNHPVNWLQDQLFTAHLARLALTLADHYYSSLTLAQAQQKGSEQWRNPNYKIYANTDWVDGQKQYKQQLDEHLIAVAHHADNIVRALPRLHAGLESLEAGNQLTGNVTKNDKADFGWQDTARKLAEKIGNDTLQHGFLGINMASTGKGKTRANAKIMTALGRQTGRVRFSVALGLRVLTLQTGKEFQEELQLNEDELAIAVGGIAVRQLFENQNRTEAELVNEQTAAKTGSESQDDLLDQDLYVHYGAKDAQHDLSKWTKGQKGLDALLAAPVLVSTIDHLMPATEGTKGGRQIAAMLRLLTSDLILDEPDDFGLEDLPALCRLVHWAGMLGSRVLLSSATMPPALAYALFQAYRAGRKEYAKANLADDSGKIVCAWFDEWKADGGQCGQFNDFKLKHKKFINSRIKKLKTLPPRRKAEIVPVEWKENWTIAQSMAEIIQAAAIDLHKHHMLCQNGKTLSIGLVRMANINPLVAVAKALLRKSVTDTKIRLHYCIYHSRYPLAMRAHIENKLDRLLKRKDPDLIWKQDEIKQAIKKCESVKHHVFIVLASPVAEVGRDHDYDWAIVEPSSMRSIIQLAGRVLRHRDKVQDKSNILLLNKNFKALKEKSVCFNRPGFESGSFLMDKHGLSEILDQKQYENITAIHRITLPEPCRRTENGKYTNLITLEHRALESKLKNTAKAWWRSYPHWCGEMQRQQRFRNSKKDEAYYLWLDNEYSVPKWRWKNEQVRPAEFGEPLVNIEVDQIDEPAAGNCFWFDLEPLRIYQKLAKDFNCDLQEISRRFGEVRLIEYGKTPVAYQYHPCLGIYQNIEENES